MKITKRLKPLGESVFAWFVGLGAGAAIMAVWGYPPIEAYRSLFNGVFGSSYGLSSTLSMAIPLMLTGLTFAIGVRGGVFNIGAEGQLFMGALAAVAVSSIHLPPGIHVLATMLAGMIAGALWSLPAAFLKTLRGVHEVISTIMLNWIALYLGMFFINNYLANPAQAEKSIMTPSTARFPILVEGTSLTYAILPAVFLAVLIYFLLWRTPLGFEIRVVGLNPEAANYAGINRNLSVIATFAFGGLAAGLAGVLQITGLPPSYALFANFSNVRNLGFDGIGVALIGRNHPIGVIFAALFFGALHVGARNMQIFAGVPLQMVRVIQGIIILALAVPELMNRMNSLISGLRAWYKEKRVD